MSAFGVWLLNSEKSHTGFIQRLKLLIGDEKPYPWAAKVGITQATFNRMWKDGVAPKSDTLLLISEKTGCSIDWLLTGEGTMKRGAVAGRVADTGTTIVSEPYTGGFAPQLSAEVAELAALLENYGNKTLKADLKAKLMKIKDMVEG